MLIFIGSDQCSVESFCVNTTCTQDSHNNTNVNTDTNTSTKPTTRQQYDITTTTTVQQNQPMSERLSTGSHCSDTSSLLSADFPYSSSKSSLPYDSSSARSTGSLRRTPLRHSVDSFSKLLEVHKQTVEKIATEISLLRCDCETLKHLKWEDFERNEETIQLGLNSYMVVPVTCGEKVGDKRRFYAWVSV